ncbi:normal mucosa of esophagus-specific gene 1 protein-like [Chironomus tepperi]|uniref:normal mucosa of esophagus-specific gene 1 protein-like n=1 Tax=Chironomus tepperi TaxID=113505 RepID=UPI00391FA316
MVLSKAISTVQQMTTRNMAVNLRHYEGKAAERDWRYFTWKGMKKNYAVLPLVFIMTGAITGLCAFIAYASKTRVDVSFNRSNPQICESMDMMNPEYNKIRNVNQKFGPNPELKAALDAIKE